ncbi:hypothetical protein RBB50_012168 [Rhinocladiella similis]
MESKGQRQIPCRLAVSMAIGFMILLSSLPLVKKSDTILMESVPIGVDPNDVKHDKAVKRQEEWNRLDRT